MDDSELTDRLARDLDGTFEALVEAHVGPVLLDRPPRPRQPARRRGGRPGRARPCVPGPRRLRAAADPRAAAPRRGWRRSSSTCAATAPARHPVRRRPLEPLVEAGREPAASDATDPATLAAVAADRERLAGLLATLPDRTASPSCCVTSTTSPTPSSPRSSGDPRAPSRPRSIAGPRAAARRSSRERARGADRMSRSPSVPASPTTLPGGLRELGAPAPVHVREQVLVEVGLADRMAPIDSPLGTLWVAWNGRGVSEVEQAENGAEAAARHEARTGRRTTLADALPVASRGHDRAPARGRAPRPDPARPARPHRVRGRGLDEGARDPAGRGPAVRLDRGGDRPAEGGPRGRDRARAQPGAADRPVPPRRPDGRHDRPVQPRRTRQQADDPRGGGAGPRRARGRGAAGRAAHPARRRRRSRAGRPAATRAGCRTATGSRSARSARRGRGATGRARSAARRRSRRPPDGRRRSPGRSIPSRNLAYWTSASRAMRATLRATSPPPGALRA